MSKFQGKIMVGGGDLIATVDNQTYQVTKQHPMYNKLLEAFKSGDADTFVASYNVKQCIEHYTTGEQTGEATGVVVKGDQVLYDGVVLNNAVVDTIRNMMQNGMDFKPMVKFLERAIKTNSKRIVDELFKFLQVCKCTITDDGCFLAYKSVRHDYLDKYSGKFLNEVGAEMRMPKWQVDDNCNVACSHGFHVGALAYAGPGGTYNSSSDKVLIVKVAPEDVVSVPYDHQCMKLRTCAYTVVGEFKGELKPSVYSGRVGTDYGKDPTPKRQRIEFDADEMVVDGVYTAIYTNKSGVRRRRYFVVLEVHDSYVIVELMEPEEHAGGTRRFNLDSLTNVKEWDGDYDDADMEDEDEDEYCGCQDDNTNHYW